MAVTHEDCAIVHKNTPETTRCWLNPLNPYSRLSLSSEKQQIADQQASTTGKSDHKVQKKSRKKNKKDERTAMAKAKRLIEDIMLVDSGTTSHMTERSETVSSRSECDISIALGDDSKVKATEKGDRR